MINIQTSPLLTDLYQLTMMQAYFNEGMNDLAVFEFFVRKLPENRHFLLVAGIEQVIAYLEQLRFSEDELDYLSGDGRFSDAFINYLRTFKFTGDVNGMAEGTLAFANEPIVQVIAPIAEAQLIESRLINILQYQIMVASKAARCVLAAPNKTLVDFGMRRAHGAEAALFSARANYIAGFKGTATLLAGKEFAIPTFGTMAHSYIQAHESEQAAFYKFAKCYSENIVLLIDTYDIERAAKTVAKLAHQLQREDINIKAVRIDSGDLDKRARQVRKILDEEHLNSITIFVSGDLDEYKLAELVRKGSPIEGFGIGTRLNTSNDAPSLDCVYKLQAYGNEAKRKQSEGKVTWPGQKQVYRYYQNQQLAYDVVTTKSDPTQTGKPLLQNLMHQGKRTLSTLTLDILQTMTRLNLAELPQSLATLDPEVANYEVKISKALKTLAAKVDARI